MSCYVSDLKRWSTCQVWEVRLVLEIGGRFAIMIFYRLCFIHGSGGVKASFAAVCLCLYFWRFEFVLSSWMQPRPLHSTRCRSVAPRAVFQACWERSGPLPWCVPAVAPLSILRCVAQHGPGTEMFAVRGEHRFVSPAVPDTLLLCGQRKRQNAGVGV